MALVGNAIAVVVRLRDSFVVAVDRLLEQALRGLADPDALLDVCDDVAGLVFLLAPLQRLPLVLDSQLQRPFGLLCYPPFLQNLAVIRMLVQRNRQILYSFFVVLPEHAYPRAFTQEIDVARFLSDGLIDVFVALGVFREIKAFVFFRISLFGGVQRLQPALHQREPLVGQRTSVVVGFHLTDAEVFQGSFELGWVQVELAQTSFGVYLCGCFGIFFCVAINQLDGFVQILDS